MSNPFQFRTPTDDEIETMQTIADKLGDLYQYVQLATPSSAERTLAIRKLQEARMWLNASIVLHRHDLESVA